VPVSTASRPADGITERLKAIRAQLAAAAG